MLEKGRKRESKHVRIRESKTFSVRSTNGKHSLKHLFSLPTLMQREEKKRRKNLFFHHHPCSVSFRSRLWTNKIKISARQEYCELFFNKSEEEDKRRKKSLKNHLKVIKCCELLVKAYLARSYAIKTKKFIEFIAENWKFSLLLLLYREKGRKNFNTPYILNTLFPLDIVEIL